MQWKLCFAQWLNRLGGCYTLFSVNHTAEKQSLISAERNATWGDRKPASTLVPVPRLALDGMLFEIDAVAVVPANQSSVVTE